MCLASAFDVPAASQQMGCVVGAIGVDVLLCGTDCGMSPVLITHRIWISAN